jgi:Flp pilus assembly protein TadD
MKNTIDTSFSHSTLEQEDDTQNLPNDLKSIESILNICVDSAIKNRKEQLVTIVPGLYALAVSFPQFRSASEIRRICDRTQYAFLSDYHKQEEIIKLSWRQIRNICHLEGPCSWAHILHDKNSHSPRALITFFYHHNTFEQYFSAALPASFHISEKLSNRILILSNKNYSYPYSLSVFLAKALWHAQDLPNVRKEELIKLALRFELFPKLIEDLKANYPDNKWELINRGLFYIHDGLTKRFDYASLVDDRLFLDSQNIPLKTMNNFSVADNDCSSFFPTISLRSLLHLKARPNVLSSAQEGFALCAAKEIAGKQSPVIYQGHDPKNALELWYRRAQRHLARHSYRARVIFDNQKAPKVLALVGEQIATLAAFPQLIKGALEQLDLGHLLKIRFLSHSEDILILASEDASWNLINSLSKRATTLFKLLSNDGSDGISLFDNIDLPEQGVGSFHFSVVPEDFFELIDTAIKEKQAMPPGHDHYLLGLAYECLNEWGLAVSEFEKALRLDSNDPDILSAYGSSLREIGQSSEAWPFLKRAFDMTQEDADLANSFGLASLECGHLEEAIRAFERSIKLSPASPDFLANLGYSYMLAKRTDEALKILHQAIKSSPNFAPAHEHLAHLHWQNGDSKLARKHALIAYKENPLDSNIANLLWQLSISAKPSKNS